LTRVIIGAFYRVYDRLGHGFLESVYRRAMAIELRKLGLRVDVEYEIEIWYDGELIGFFRADLLVERRVIVETKAWTYLVDADRRQTLNYLRGSSLELGLLLHFGPRPSVQRVIFSNERKQRSRPAGSDDHSGGASTGSDDHSAGASTQTNADTSAD
jgi:GxxExxY protein